MTYHSIYEDTPSYADVAEPHDLYPAYRCKVCSGFNMAVVDYDEGHPLFDCTDCGSDEAERV